MVAGRSSDMFDGLLPRDLFVRSLIRHGARPCLIAGDRRLTYAELDLLSNRLANALAARGVRHGDVVAFYLRNGVEVLAADLAIMKLGAVRTPLNEMLSADDVAYMLDHSGAKAFIAHASFAEALAQASAEVAAVPIRLIVADDAAPEGFDDFDEAVAAASDAPPPRPALSADDRMMLAYTGGTTGRSKGVVHRMGPLALNFFCHQMCSEIAADDHLLVHSPLAHAAGFFALTGLLIGAKITIAPRFDPGELLRQIEEEGVTWTFMVPTMIYRVLDHPEVKTRDLSGLRTIFYGAAPITAARLREGLAAFGPVFKQLYGQTEAPNFIAALDKADHENPDLQRACGQPSLFSEVAIRDASGVELPRGEVGEITVRAPFTLAEYHDDPDKTAEAYHGDWLRTGDVGRQVESGHIFLVDRAKDMIISGGMNVYSTEVENVVQEHPSVAQVVVIGVPDEDWGEAVAALVVPAPGAFDPADVMAFAKSKLAKYKAPKRVEAIEAVPLTGYGKPDKKALRAQFWAGRERAIN